jgi:hypothetical protein
MRLRYLALAAALLAISGGAEAQVTPAPTLGPGSGGVSAPLSVTPGSGAGAPTAPTSTGAFAPVPSVGGGASTVPTPRGPGLINGTSVMIPGSPINGWAPQNGAGSGLLMVPGQVPQPIVRPP